MLLSRVAIVVCFDEMMKKSEEKLSTLSDLKLSRLSAALYRLLNGYPVFLIINNQNTALTPDRKRYPFILQLGLYSVFSEIYSDL